MVNNLYIKKGILDMRKIVVGSRESVLAVMQTELVMDQIKMSCPDVLLELKTYKTTGDKILDQPLDKVGGKGLFVKELDQALLDGTIDLAVHSLKDVPMQVNEELPIVAVVKRGDPRDVLVLPDRNESVSDLSGMVIGSSSMRRGLQLKAMYPEITVKSIRGNIQTRLRKLDEGEFDAIILAAAGLQRANLSHRISRAFTIEEMLPAAGQGILVIQARKDFDVSLLKNVIDEQTWIEAKAERAFVTALDGGCTSPVAAYAKFSGEQLTLEGLYYREQTGEIFREQITGAAKKAEQLGREFAAYMKEKYR